MKFADQCVGNGFLDLYHKESFDMTKLKYPIMTDPKHEHVFHPMMVHFGGVSTDGRGMMTGARAMKLIFMFDESTKLKKQASRTFLGAMRTLVSNLELETATVTAYSPLDVEKELINNIQTAFKNNFSIIIIVICGFSLYSCMRTDWGRSKPLMGAVGLLCIILAALSGILERYLSTYI